MDQAAAKLQMEPVDMSVLTERIVSQLESRLDDCDGQIQMDFDIGSHYVLADALHLGNIIQNLLDNALKYSRERPRIHITSTISEKLLHWSIRDEGIGIDRKYIDKLHHKFFRVPTGDVHNAKGFGLGLHYVFQIIDRLGWTIHIESTINEGTTITLKAPIHQLN